MKALQHLLALTFAVLFFASCDKGESPATPDPVHKIVVSKALVVAGTSITFTDSSSGTVSSREWIFEGGTPGTSTDKIANVTYSTSGAKKVTLKLTKDGKVFSKTFENIVNILPSGLVAYLPLNGNMNEYYGALTYKSSGGVSLTTDRKGKSNSAYLFQNSASTKANIVYNKVKHGGSQTEVTLATWLKPNYDMSDTTQRHVFLGHGYGQHQCYYEVGYITFELYNVDGNGVTRQVSFFKSQKIKLNKDQWYHVAITSKANEKAKIYIDGVLNNDTQDSPKKLYDGEFLMYLGSDYYGFNASIDDVFIFNKAISSDEIVYCKNGFDK